MISKDLLSYTYYDFLVRNVNDNANKPFLISDSEEITFGMAKNVIDSLAYQLYSFGVRKGNIVALSGYRDMKIVLIEQALALTGAITFLVDYHKSPDDFIKESNADLHLDYIIFNENGKWVIRTERRSSILSVDSAMFMDKSLIEMLSSNNRNSDPSLIIFTSGSSGNRKAVLLSQLNYLANFASKDSLFHEESYDLSISVLPMHHIFALASIINAMTCFHPIYFPSFLNQEYVLRKTAERGVTVFYGVPTYYLSLVAAMEKNPISLKTVRSGVIAAGPCTYEQLVRIESTLGFPLTPVYGMSECFGISTIRYDEDQNHRYRGVGRVFPLNDVRIVDSDLNDVPSGTEGEIVVSGTTVMLGYYRNKDDIRPTRDEKGYFHTGDLGMIDPEGILYLTGRIKDLIIRGGENISSKKVEKAFLSLPYVEKCSVVGIHDDYYGEVPAALIVLKEGSENVTATSMKVDISALLVKAELPKEIRIAEEIPMLTTGKVDKQTIKRMFDE